MRVTVAVMVLAVGAQALWAAEVYAQTWDFEDADVGKLPAGWMAAKTGEGEGSIWKVVEDKSAPSGARVLAQVAQGASALFNICVVDGKTFEDLAISVRFKAVDGKVDQGGGIVWRYIDANNYYIARFNPLEDNFRLYKVVDGKRVQLATKEELKAPIREWHTLAIKMKGDVMECSLNGKTHLEAKDATFAKVGKIGLWTKADAQTYFDKLDVAAIK